MLSNVAARLLPGGTFVATIPDGNLPGLGSTQKARVAAVLPTISPQCLPPQWPPSVWVVLQALALSKAPPRCARLLCQPMCSFDACVKPMGCLSVIRSIRCAWPMWTLTRPACVISSLLHTARVALHYVCSELSSGATSSSPSTTLPVYAVSFCIHYCRFFFQVKFGEEHASKRFSAASAFGIAYTFYLAEVACHPCSQCRLANAAIHPTVCICGHPPTRFPDRAVGIHRFETSQLCGWACVSRRSPNHPAGGGQLPGVFGASTHPPGACSR
jgi:hypothetical protein